MFGPFFFVKMRIKFVSLTKVINFRVKEEQSSSVTYGA